MMGFESLSAMYRPACTVQSGRDRSWLVADVRRAESRNLPAVRGTRFVSLRRVAARFVALLS